MTERLKHIIAIFIASALLIKGIPLAYESDITFIREGIRGETVISPGEFINIFVIGGFRGLAASILWIQADKHWHAGEVERVFPLYRIITYLQPYFIEAWAMGGWHLAYNLYVLSEDLEQKRYLVDRGIRFYKEGIAHNYHHFQLPYELGWVYFDKMRDYLSAIRYFRMAMRAEQHPSFVPRVIAHMYREKGDIINEYRMWLYNSKVFLDDQLHMEITRRFLKSAKQRLKEMGIEIRDIR
jgi:hypothetical protein